MIEIYTDGSARGNPGNGGYATILTYKGHEKILSEGFRHTTNNRMELLAVIRGLEEIKKNGEDVHIYADSKYVIDAVQKKWVMAWEKKSFKNKKNIDLWQRFLKVFRRHHVKMTWVEGHAGHTYNERCDQLATQAALKGPWKVDHAYEQVMTPPQ